MNIWIFFGLLLFGAYSAYYLLTTVKSHCQDARGQLRGYLKQRYDLIPIMVSSVKHQIPELGDMMGKLIELRLESAKALNETESDQMKHEIYQMLYDLIEQSAPVNAMDESIRHKFQEEFKRIEKNIKASHDYYLCAVQDYNNFITSFPYRHVSKLVKAEVQAVYYFPEIKEPDVSKGEDALKKFLERSA